MGAAKRTVAEPSSAAAARSLQDDPKPFWRRKTLAEMTQAEWESLCDGCGRCCLHKLEEEDTGRIHFTNIGCALLDSQSCRCTDYKNRAAKVSDCVQLDTRELATLTWMPPTCAYRLVGERKDLSWWHPLVSGDPETVHLAGVSVRGRDIVPEEGLRDEDYDDYIVQWPGRVPKAARDKAVALKLARKKART